MQPEDSTTEEWRPVVGWEDLYEVSNQGRVRSKRRVTPYSDGRRVGHYRERILRQNGKGRPCVMFSHRGKYTSQRVQCLVLEAFHGPRLGRVVRHLDGNFRNNRADNLAWGTQQDNMEDARRHGTLALGERVGSSKLTEESVREIRRLADNHLTPYRSIAAKFGVTERHVQCIKSRKTWQWLGE